MKNEDELIAQLTQLHFDNEKRIVILEKNHEAFIQWLVRAKEKTDILVKSVTRPWWKKLFAIT